MKTLERWVGRSGRWLVPARWLILALALWWAASGMALAQRKSKDQAPAAPQKSYVASYFIVLAVLSIGLFTALRPASRLDKMPEKIKEDDEE